MIVVHRRLIFFMVGLGVLILLNLLVVDYILFKVAKEEPKLIEVPLIIRDTKEQEPSTSVVTPGLTRVEVEEIVKQATRSLKPKEEKKPAPTTQPVQASTVKEFFVHLGSGSSTAQDWEDVPGAEAYIDSTKYGRIKNAYFEASLHTPTGNQTAYVRLYNVTDKNVVWPTELSIEGGEPKLLVSASMTLPSGNKLYRVQMKTQLRALTNLIQARVRIITE